MPIHPIDLSPLKKQLIEGLENISMDINRGIETLNKDSYCVLGELKDLKDKLELVETMASSFYLNTYLSSFTNKNLEITTCIQHLSHKRHGALIVIELEDQVDPFIRVGTTIGATVTTSLLESIFYPGNPLHDGAVLIRADQIVSAANVLPLSDVGSDGKKLGTRHRAALGLSEKSDAMALLVSEETGMISFVKDGTIFPVRRTSTLL